MNKKVTNRKGERFKSNLELNRAAKAQIFSGMNWMNYSKINATAWSIGITMAMALTPSIASGMPRQNSISIEPAGLVHSAEGTMTQANPIVESGWSIAGFEINLTNLAGAFCFSALVGLVGYSLLTIGISLFREIAAAGHGSSDWDEG